MNASELLPECSECGATALDLVGTGFVECCGPWRSCVDCRRPVNTGDVPGVVQRCGNCGAPLCEECETRDRSGVRVCGGCLDGETVRTRREDEDGHRERKYRQESAA
jgi:hypothetical protein